jgi:hypothetical protein
MLFALSILAGCSSSGGGSTPAPTATLSANPSTLTGPGNSKLTFASMNATQGSIDNGVGPIGTSGSVIVPLSATTTYTYTATGPGGSATAQATVTVDLAPTVNITASPNPIPAGQSTTTLTVTATNATQVVIVDNVDSTTHTLGANGGNVTVAPAGNTTYMATASGANGSTAVATVMVTVAPAVTLSVSPSSIISGQKAELSWSSTNDDTASIDNGIGSVPASGTRSVSPAPGITTYTITVSGLGGTATASATVTASPLNSSDGMMPDSTNTGQQDIDPNGAVGTRQFMEYVNTEYQAFDKNTLAPVPIAGVSGPQAIGIPWSTALNGAVADCSGTGIQLDGVINFDRLASRWVIAAKAVRSAGTQHRYDFCIAVSNTDDVTSTSPPFGWYAYAFQLDLVLGQNNGIYYFPDWPKLGIWSDAYYATLDMQDTQNGLAQVGVVVCAFDRIDMLTGSAMKAPQCFQNINPNLFSNGLYLAHSLIPADLDGTTPPPSGRDEFMVSIENPVNDGTTMTSSTFNLWDFHVDWTTPANSSFTLVVPSPAVTTYTPGCYLFITGAPALTNCVPEPFEITGQTIDSVGDRFMPRFAYRNFGTHESFLVSHTVQTGLDAVHNPLQTGVRWYELRDSGSGTPSVYQEGTINPDNSLFRFLPSIAQDKVGNAAVGYSFSNSLTNPGIAFSYWDLGTIGAPTTEVTIFKGPSEEVTTATGRGQWGTYSSMTVDPVDDCTFWYVNEYWPTTSDWATRIANFKIPGCQ